MVRIGGQRKWWFIVTAQHHINFLLITEDIRCGKLYDRYIIFILTADDSLDQAVYGYKVKEQDPSGVNQNEVDSGGGPDEASCLIERLGSGRKNGVRFLACEYKMKLK
jgi:hypothetical protein